VLDLNFETARRGVACSRRNYDRIVARRGSPTTFGGLVLKYLKRITIMRRISIIKSEIIKSYVTLSHL